MKKLLPIILIVCTGCHTVNHSLGLRDDNPIEQGIEQTIEETTGVQVDFTPEQERYSMKKAAR